jgi:DNA repair protein RadD
MDTFFPNEQEIDQAADILAIKYNISQQLLAKLLGKNQKKRANELLKKFGHSSLTKLQIARLLVLVKGPELFCGSTKLVRDLRFQLLSKLLDNEVIRLCKSHTPTKKILRSPSFMRKPLAEMKWVSRGPWPIAFVKALGFPEIFAGVRQTDVKPTVQDIPPFRKLPGLAQFQIPLK